VAERARVVRDGAQVALRPQPSVVQLPRRHRSSLLGSLCRRLLEPAAPRKTKAREAGAARAFDSREIVEDQDVTATSTTRPKSRVATRASVQQQGVASCIRTAKGYARPGEACQESRGSVAMLYSPGPLWPATRRAPSSRPPPASPPAHLRSPSGMRPGGAQGRRGFAPADLATHGAHHHGCAAPARRGARGLAAHAAPPRRRGRSPCVPGPRLRVLPQGRRRAVRGPGPWRPGPGADRYGKASSARLLPRSDPQSPPLAA